MLFLQRTFLNLLLSAQGILAYSLGHRWEKLQDLSSSASTMDLNSKLFNMLTEEPRNYTLFVFLTTTNQEHNCVACKEFALEYDLLAKGAKKTKTPLYFGVLPFGNAQDVFQQLGIQNVPLLIRYPPTEGSLSIREKYDTVDLARAQMKAEPIADYISEKYNVKVHIARPIDYTNYMITAALGFFVIVMVMFLKDFAYALLNKKLPWMVFTIAFATINTGGYMWNTIRNPPFIAAGQNGQPSFIAGGFQNQYGVETFIIAGIYALVSIALLALVTVVPKLGADSQRSGTYAALGVFVCAYSFLLLVFRLKNGSYPFKLLF